MPKPYISPDLEEKFVALYNSFINEAAVQDLSVPDTLDAVAYLTAIFSLSHGKTLMASLDVFEDLLSRAKYHYGTQGLSAIVLGAKPDQPLNLGPPIDKAPNALNNFLKPKD